MRLTARSATDLARAAEIIATLPAKKTWHIEVSEFRHKRTDAQNRLLWLVYTGVATATGHTPEEIHEACKAMFLPQKVLAIGEKSVTVSGSTAEQDIPAFSEYVERVRAWASNELGVVA